MADRKPDKLKARLPRGLADRGPSEIAAARDMIERIRRVYEIYGFEPGETPEIEYTDALGKFLPDQDRPNEGVFSFKDDDGQWLSLRYDLTAPLARYVAENFDTLPKPYRSYRFGWVFRNEKPGPGRFRQFLQFDADTVGSASPAADAELCMMAADTMEALGIRRGDYVVKVNSRKILDGLMDAIQLGGDDGSMRRLVVLRAIDKLDRLGPRAVFQLLTIGRKDESGDFTKGADLTPAQADNVMRFLGFSRGASSGDLYQADGALTGAADNAARLDWLQAHVELGATGRKGLAELRELASLTRAADYDETRVLIDRSVVRGLEYYTGPVFEVELALETTDEAARPVRFGSVGGGGRYDGLVARFRGEMVPATGFSIGVSRLTAALAHVRGSGVGAGAGPVVVTVFDSARLDQYQRMVKALRDAGIRAELYLGAGRMGAQLKYADRRGSPCVVIQGPDEAARGEVQIKDLIEGAKAAAAVASNQEWRASRPAQFAVPQEKLVETVREVIERQNTELGA